MHASISEPLGILRAAHGPSLSTQTEATSANEHSQPTLAVHERVCCQCSPACVVVCTGDGYVHRLIQSKTGGKLVEVPSPAPTCPTAVPAYTTSSTAT